jgi:hypothetical protein
MYSELNENVGYKDYKHETTPVSSYETHNPSVSSPVTTSAAASKTPAALVEVNTEESEGNLTLSHIEIKESEFVAFMDKYRANLDEKQRNSFSDSRDTLKNMKRGYEQHVMKFSRKEGNIDGMLCVNIDHTR